MYVVDVFSEIRKPLHDIFKKSINTGVFPNELKIAKVTPIFKTDDQSLVSNYRPISVLPVFSKILERIMYNRVFTYLNNNKLLYEKQFGFQNNTSTDHAILDLVNNISKSFEQGKFTLGIFIDLSKAFDTVDHNILLKKLNKYGIKGSTYDWFLSYLSNRKQCVSINKVTNSPYLKITCGVPQGSILGPLLFLLYVNDFPKASPILSPIMFADDTNLFYSSPSINVLYNTVNRELHKVHEWFQVNKLSLNLKKTKYSLFHSSHQRKKIPEILPTLQIASNNIERDTVTKFLGVLIDENLSWKPHINVVNSKVSKNIGLLYKARLFLNIYNLKQLYFSFVHSYLNYANIAWASTHKSKLITLYRRQKHASRLIHFKDKFTHAQPLLKSMNALNIFQINIYQYIIFMYKCKHNLLPRLYQNSFQLSTNKYDTRSTGNFLKPSTKTKLCQFAVPYRGPHLWNSIISKELSITSSLTIETFKSKLKQYILNIENTSQYF